MSGAVSAPLVAASHKAYLGAAATMDWVRSVVSLPQVEVGPVAKGSVELAVLPSFPMLVPTAAAADHVSISMGAQDCAPTDDGAQTGEVTAQLLAELGVRYVEVAHAERRRLFGEDDALCAAKAEVAGHRGLVPLVCVGELERGDPQAAADECRRQLRAVAPEDRVPGELVVAYEPVWAIGAAEPASADHVVSVCQAIRAELNGRDARWRVLYGGSAGPGTYERIASAVDGLFLGRFAHDPANLGIVIDEVAAIARVSS